MTNAIETRPSFYQVIEHYDDGDEVKKREYGFEYYDDAIAMFDEVNNDENSVRLYLTDPDGVQVMLNV
jgi:hypothetical protein